MRILAIETSCDDTCVSIVKVKSEKSKVKSFDVLSNVVSSQVKIHQKYGGVYPFLAKREHQKNLPIVFKKALKDSGNPKIDLIAVTVGPGLEPCLWVGVNFAKELAKKLKIPIIPVNHIEAHILANFLGENSKSKNRASINGSEGEEENEVLFACQNSKLFPAVCLVVSGGHTQLILMKGFGKYRIIGETRDDAAGECFDKTARILGLGYPGGPIIARMAIKSKTQNSKLKINLPRPMLHTKDYDFSFSGLKTAVLYDFKNRTSKIRKFKKYIQAMCAEIQQAVIDVLIKKTIKAAKDYKAKSIILGGGVAANEELRKQLREKIKKEMSPLQYFFPDVKCSTDNAVMVALAGYFNQQEKRNWKKIKANANLKIGKKI